MNIRFGIIWTKLAIALGLWCLISGFTVSAQTKPEAPLDEDAAAALIETLVDELPNLIEDEDQVTAITKKWDAHEDLAGKTRTQILGLLFADVKSVVRDAETQDDK